MIDSILNPQTPSKAQLTAAFSMVTAVAEAVREAGRIPSGTVYAIICGKVTAEGYSKILGILKNAGLVEERHHELIWIGPEVLSK